MTYKEARSILHPDTTAEAIAEYRYYGGFSEHDAGLEAVNQACLLACEALDKLIEEKEGGQ